jgi:tetratricopeptide (TPR) repeat protein
MPTMLRLLVSILAIAAQSPALTYASLVEQYARGDIDAAIHGLAMLRQSDVTDAARHYTNRRGAAPMLHTELANDTIDTTPVRATFHIERAHMIVRAMLERKDDSDALDFARHWYELAASIYLARTRLDDAARVIRDGLAVSPNDAALYVAQGVILERQIVLQQPGLSTVPMLFRRLPGSLSLSGGRPDGNQSNGKWLEAAAAQYRHALDLDARHVTARLRLGWVHVQLKDGRAQADLERALTDASDAPTRYLAHLFLGGVAEREQRWSDAEREYEAARGADSRFASACIALSRVESVTGHTDRARELALDCLRLQATDDDPWWAHQLGAVDADAMSWLRTAVRFQP